MARESNKPDAPNPNLKCSHILTKVCELILFTTNMCPLELGDNENGFDVQVDHEEVPLKEGAVESDDEEVPPSIGKQMRKRVKKLLERTIFFRVHRSNKNFYVLRCSNSAYSWKLRTTKLKDFDLFKVSKYERTHTCQKVQSRQDHKQAKSWVIAKPIQSKYEDVSRGYMPKEIIQNFPKEFDIDLSYDRTEGSRGHIFYGNGVLQRNLLFIGLVWRTLKIANSETQYNFEVDPNGHF
ncbi:hypothetical protein Csa_022657 [Cucumis sativus]|uniref:Transposase MuDR plant domain-containing protein n=1 Tax=Cucumis sativus TaxID=3659 RepID=A0A0A0K9J4_CUCSA|nr:hypothetical protein Csa_022657 [Cucumis sativus]